MKKIFAAALILLLLLCALCPAACAEGAGGMQKGDILYLGEYNNAPLRWRVLDPAATNVGEPGVFLVTEQTLTNQGVVYSWAKAIWKGSEGQQWCAGLLGSVFSEAERAAIPAVSKTEEAFQQYGLSWGAVSLEEEQVFFLSAKELGDYVGPNDGDPGISASYIGDGRIAYYWLRTPHANHVDYAGLVIESDQVHDFLVYGSWGARPATNLSGEALLYVSPAERALEPCEAGPLPGSESGEWKATVIDSALSFTVEDCRFENGELTVSCSGVPQGAWLSLFVKDAEGQIVSYACLRRAESAQEVFSLTPELPEGGTLCVFAEKDQGAQRTNTASAPVALEWVEEPLPTETPEPTEAPAEEERLSEEQEMQVTPAPNLSGGPLGFLRQYWMFALPFAVLSLLAIAVALLKKLISEKDDDDEDEDEEDEDFGDEDEADAEEEPAEEEIPPAEDEAGFAEEPEAPAEDKPDYTFDVTDGEDFDFEFDFDFGDEDWDDKKS